MSTRPTAVNTAQKQQIGRPFDSGKSGNPKGRPPGSRNKLSEAFLADLCSDFEQHGAGVIQKVREERPQDYLRVVASIIPKDFNIATRPKRAVEMTDAELLEIIALARSGGDEDEDDTAVH